MAYLEVSPGGTRRDQTGKGAHQRTVSKLGKGALVSRDLDIIWNIHARVISWDGKGICSSPGKWAALGIPTSWHF